MTNLQYKSVFDATKQIDIANYLTEQLMLNWLRWRKWPNPTGPAWQKEISENSDRVKEFRQKYIAELPFMKNLLKVFSPHVISNYIKENNIVGFQIVKLENRKKYIFDMYLEQVKLVKKLEGINKKELEQTEDKMDFISTQTKVKKTGFLGDL